MCDNCAEHGNGKKWFLNVENYTKKIMDQATAREKKLSILVAPSALIGQIPFLFELLFSFILLLSHSHKKPIKQNIIYKINEKSEIFFKGLLEYKNFNPKKTNTIIRYLLFYNF